MQDDAYIIVQDGWQAGTVLRQLIVKKGEKLKETPDLIIGKNKYKADLIPPQLLIATYFSAEQGELDRLQGVQDAISQEIESFIEEHGGEDGLLADAKNDKDKVTKASIIARKKEVKGAGDKDELAVLDKCLSRFTAETAARKKVKDAQLGLDQKVFANYPTLTDEEVQTLVVDHKWMAHLESTIAAEIERITQQLTGRVKTLEERYAEPLPQLVSDVEQSAGKVEEHLRGMGLSW